MIENLDIYNFKANKTPKVILATHNKSSAELGMMLNKNQTIFDFAHLQGMREKYYDRHVKNQTVHVYIPYGPYNEMIPYLIRRLYENMDVLKHIF